MFNSTKKGKSGVKKRPRLHDKEKRYLLSKSNNAFDKKQIETTRVIFRTRKVYKAELKNKTKRNRDKAQRTAENSDSIAWNEAKRMECDRLYKVWQNLRRAKKQKYNFNFIAWRNVQLEKSGF